MRSNLEYYVMRNLLAVVDSVKISKVEFGSQDMSSHGGRQRKCTAASKLEHTGELQRTQGTILNLPVVLQKDL
jgi:hypothetical protein